MTEKVANIAKNTSYFTLALIMQKVISLAYFTIYARVLGPADLGKYYFAISFTTIFSIALDLGLTNLLTREVAKDQTKAGSLLRTAIGVKWLLSVVTIVLMLIVIKLQGYNTLIVSLILVSVVSMLADSFSNLFFAFSRAFHNLKYESISAVLAQLVTLLVSLAVFYYHGSLVALMWAQAASSFFALIYAGAVIHWRWHLSLVPSWDFKYFRTLLLMALPFGIYAIAQRFYNYLDSVLLFQLAGDSAVGIYQIPFRAVNAFQFLPMAFIASLYPALSTYWHSNREQLAITFERAINYSLIIALPLCIGLASIAGPVVNIFATGFESAVLPFQVSAITIFFMFMNYPVGALLNACDRQKLNTRNMVITAVVSVLMNLILIKSFGVMGAISTAVITTALLFALNFWEARQVVKLKASVMFLLLKVLASSLLMAVAIYWLNQWLNILVVVALAVLVYFSCLLVLGGIKKEDVFSVIKSFQK